MNVVSLNQPNLMDIPNMLRSLANELEASKEAIHAIVVLELPDGDIDIRGYGEVGAKITTEVGLLHMAAVKMSIVE